MTTRGHHGLLMGDGSGFPTQTVLSSTNKSSDIILSNSDRDAESNSTTGGGIVLSASGKGAADGKLYAEAHVQTIYSTLNALGFGLHRNTSDLTVYLGADTNGWGVWDEGANTNSNTQTNATVTNSASGGDAQPGVAYCMAVDLGAGKIWFRVSSRSSGAWIGGGNPALGTSPAYTFTPGADTYYIALCPRRGATTPTTNRNKLRLALPQNWLLAAPAGFGVWT